MNPQKILTLSLSLLAFSCNNNTLENKKAEKIETLVILKNSNKNIPGSETKTLDTLDLSKQEKKLLPIITKIVKTSPVFMAYTKGLKKAIIKNGGSGWILEYSNKVSSEKEQTELYYFDLYEVYENRTPRIASFCFDINKKQLYEEQLYDDVHLEARTLKPLKFDKKLLSGLEMLMNVTE
jgi:hypothetical protein